MPVGRVIAANLSASECAWRHGDWGLVSAASVFFPTRAARAAPALNQLRLLGFSFLNFFFLFGSLHAAILQQCLRSLRRITAKTKQW